MTSPVTRERKNIDLFINSANRDLLNSISSTDFRINVINPAKSKILLCGLKSVTFPNGLYNVQESVIEITDSLGLEFITIPKGNYTSTSLATLIENNLNALAVDTYTVTIINNKFTITSSFPGFVLNPNLLISELLKNMGFESETSYAGASITAPNIYDLSGIKNLFIKISQISAFIRNSFNIKYNFKFDVTCEFGKIIFFSNESKYLQEYDVSADNLVNNSYFDIQLVDEYGNVVDNNGLDWNFTIKLSTQDLNLP